MALRTHALALGQGEVPEQFKISHVRELQGSWQRSSIQ